ncbi:MAG: hypothetical protein QOE33_1113 [Acidobacteriota bacterium]|nr:hypothetical protein [Acidobacteriota bacterium]
MKQVLRLSTFALALFCLAAAQGFAQTPTPTPDPFVAQISNSAGDTFARDITGDGRFVVIESTGDIATVPPGQTAANKSPNNADGNIEIFLYDLAQRRVFQITDTRSVVTDTTITSSTSARFTQSNIAVAISNARPMISRDGKWIVFQSNAPTPNQFYGDTLNAADTATAKADSNTEIFLYRIPDVTPASLTSGDTADYVDLRRGTFTRLTNTPASRIPTAGTATIPPFAAEDNREAQINDDGSRITFVSTRNLATVNGKTNADFSPEVYAYNRTTSGITQITVTSLDQNLFVFTINPNISGNTSGDSVIAFASNATDLRAADANVNIASGNSDGDTEIFVATYNGSNVTSMKQATRTKRKVVQDTVNFFNPGRRMTNDGSLIAFESVAADPKGDNSATNDPNRAIFVYNVAADTFTQVGPRAVSTTEVEDVLRFPTFAATDNTRVVFISDLNLKADATRVAQSDATGLNPSRLKQIFSATIGATSTVTRLTNLTGTDPGFSMQAFVSNTQERISFSLANFEFGTGNSDRANEAYYLVTPPAPSSADTAASASALAFFTGASRIPVLSPTATPTPTPSPAPLATGLAIGEIGVVTTTTGSPATLAPSSKSVCTIPTGCDAASESQHIPSLPFELNGVSLSVNGAAAGLYFVSPNEIQFVVPPGLAVQTGTATYPVTINIRNGATVRTVRTILQVVAAQPDVFTSTSDAGGRAAVTNVTNPLLSTGTPEPFTVTTTYVNASGTSTTSATRLRLVLTGVRGVLRGALTVRLTKSDGTTVDLTGDAIPTDPQATDIPGVFTLDIILPASLAGAGDVKVTVLVTGGASSRPAATAPSFRIN